MPGEELNCSAVPQRGSRFHGARKVRMHLLICHLVQALQQVQTKEAIAKESPERHA